MEEGRKEYEISYLLTALDSEQEVVSVLKQNGAEIFHQKPATSVALSYVIKKHPSAYFGFCHFTAEAAAIKPIDETLKLKKSVLRFLIITPPVKMPAPRVMPGQPDVSGKPEKKVPAAASTTLSNEALSEKLEEILK